LIKLDIIAGARPNFMKIAPIIEALGAVTDKVKYRLVHTGQHYDEKMSGSFFKELGIPKPDINLEVGSGSQAAQTARIMMRYEELLFKNPADCCLVVGDVTSTMACSIVAKKMGLKVVHVEGGIRSNDLSMPEEINRMVTDAITDYFFTTSEVANENLRNLGHTEDQICFVGNTMIDTLLKNMDRLQKPPIWGDFGLLPGKYFVMTLHRPANVDEEYKLAELIHEVVEGARSLPIVFPVHPRTAKVLQKLGIHADNLHMIEPLGYLEFNYLVRDAFAVITDSGGITEETTVMKVPCLTLRDNTERPETITLGTNELVGTAPEKIMPFMDRLHEGNWKEGRIPPLWDGKTGERIVRILLEKLG
jgi:UDP-N-acetylglucosamine 2-epimerase (non-hydrolysing)